MSNINWLSRICVAVLLAAAAVAGVSAQARSPEGSATIKITPLSQRDGITPKFSARLSDQDGLQLTESEVLVAPFTLQALIGGDRVEVSLRGLRLDQLLWVADPLGCEDNDPKTKCHPTWGAEYSGRTDVDVPVHVEFADGGVGFSDYGVVNLYLNVTVVDDKVRDIEGVVQITYSTVTNLPNYRIPILGKLK